LLQIHLCYLMEDLNQLKKILFQFEK